MSAGSVQAIDSIKWKNSQKSWRHPSDTPFAKAITQLGMPLGANLFSKGARFAVRNQSEITSLLTAGARQSLREQFASTFQTGAAGVCTALPTSRPFLESSNFFETLDLDNDLSYYSIGTTYRENPDLPGAVTGLPTLQGSPPEDILSLAKIETHLYRGGAGMRYCIPRLGIYLIVIPPRSPITPYRFRSPPLPPPPAAASTSPRRSPVRRLVRRAEGVHGAALPAGSQRPARVSRGRGRSVRNGAPGWRPERRHPR